MTTVNLALPAGSNIPTQVNLKDGTVLTPNASGVISLQVPSPHLMDLLNAGWQIQGSWTGQSHVP